MTIDSTMQFSTNLSRADIEAKLPQLRAFAEAAQLADVAKLLTGTAGLSNAELEARMVRCLEQLGAKDEYALLIDQLDMFILNLRKLK